MRERLIKLNHIYDLCEELGISESDYDDFIDDNEDTYDCNLDKIIGILEMAIKIKNELSDKFSSCELNDYYENRYRWDADDIGVRIYVDNVNDCDVNIILEKDSMEVTDTYYVDETAEMFNLDEYKKACEYAVNMEDVEKKYRDED